MFVFEIGCRLRSQRPEDRQLSREESTIESKSDVESNGDKDLHMQGLAGEL